MNELNDTNLFWKLYALINYETFSVSATKRIFTVVSAWKRNVLSFVSNIYLHAFKLRVWNDFILWKQNLNGMQFCLEYFHYEFTELYNNSFTILSIKQSFFLVLLSIQIIVQSQGMRCIYRIYGPHWPRRIRWYRKCFQHIKFFSGTCTNNEVCIFLSLGVY